MKVLRRLPFDNKGFTLIEILVVIAIIGILAIIVVPNVIQFIQAGNEEARETELHDIRTAVTIMLADQALEELDTSHTAINDMDLVTANSGALLLSDYLTGLDTEGKVRSGCSYDFSIDGTVTQTAP